MNIETTLEALSNKTGPKIMKKAIYKVIITSILLIHPTGVFADNVKRILFSGSDFLYPLPAGFCNITEYYQGIIMMEPLDKQKNR